MQTLLTLTHSTDWSADTTNKVHYSAEIEVQTLLTLQYNGKPNTSYTSYHHYNGVQSLQLHSNCHLVFSVPLPIAVKFSLFKLSIWLKYKSLSGVAQMSCFMVVYSTGGGWSLELVSSAGGIF